MGSLVVVGIGIKMAAHITAEARAYIEQADQVFFLVNGDVTAKWVQQLNPSSESLASFYANHKRRRDSYQDMVEHILAAVHQGGRICAVFYGHPGVFVFPSHEMIRRARQAGFAAMMLPAISAQDCLFADLGIDPARYGCQCFEATDFLIRPRQFDTCTGLVLWQIGVISDLSIHEMGSEMVGLLLLTEVLLGYYGRLHEVVVYEAAVYPVTQPTIQYIELAQLPQARVTPISTLYVPPRAMAAIDENRLKRLGLSF